MKKHQKIDFLMTKKFWLHSYNMHKVDWFFLSFIFYWWIASKYCRINKSVFQNTECALSKNSAYKKYDYKKLNYKLEKLEADESQKREIKILKLGWNVFHPGINCISRHFFYIAQIFNSLELLKFIILHNN